ncbi:hypothetical protein SAMN02910447_01880 [Ruminococcus sp. YE71]|uniref:hypothetical protein n=1 Tax=unclassified Ruminococcus TaxID=2608920 RepID=UPI00087F8413|nr:MULTISPECIES: hypothetical protein [unclassified Ruminococcus]SDA20772.1 hypothetical protein SAMN02910446_01790 [Ruminococcus sp. YE78]SFW33663.1 hypothetical protein SAMN02910447_01880 [Ruminococcus sp. YE71]
MGKGIETGKGEKDFIPDEDFEYERGLAEEERRRQEEAEEKRLEIEHERILREKKAREARDRRIAQDKLDLMKMKAGIATEEEEIKEVHEEKRELHGMEKAANFWYHEKMWIILGTFFALVLGFIIYDLATKVDPDIEILLICDNVLQNDESAKLLEKRIEQYTPDLNSDGKVYVQVIICPLNDQKYNTLYQTNSQKFFANLQQDRIIMVLTDSNTDPDLQALMTTDLSLKIPDNPYIDDKGLSLNFGFLADELKAPALPNDIHLCMRRPVNTLDGSVEEMQANFDKNLEILTDLANALAQEAKEKNDQGLTTEPTPNDPSAVTSLSSGTASE